MSSMTSHNDRALEDLIQAERQMKETWERASTDYRSLITDLAFRFAGEKLENLRRDNPNIPNIWSVGEWRSFWLGVSGVSAVWAAKGANNNEAAELKEELKKLKEQLLKFQNQVEILKKGQVNGNQLKPTMAAVSTPVIVKPQQPIEKPKASPPVVAVKTDSDLLPLSGVLDEMCKAIKSLVDRGIPQVPVRFDSRLGCKDSPLRYRRQVMALYLIAVHSLSVRLEIDRIMSSAEGVKPRSNAFKKAIDEMGEKGLLFHETLTMTTPFETSLAVNRLSEEGKQLCRIYGWEIVESEWERIINGHQGEDQKEHTLGILTLAMHARARGYTVSVLPDIEGPAKPDLMLSKDDDVFYVEVERGDGSPAKWRNLAGLQQKKRVAICAFDPDGRKTLVNDCKLDKLPGVATDLKSLIFDDKGEPRSFSTVNPNEDIWLENWQ